MMHRALLLFLPFAMAAHSQDKVAVSIETPHGAIEWKEHTREDGRVAELSRELTADELRGLEADAQQAKAFVQRYATTDAKVSHPIDELDFAFAGWMASTDPEKERGERVIRMLGSVYGFYCMEHLGMRWAWTEDEFGVDIALVCENPAVRSFPFTSIRYRIEDKKTDFIYALYASLEHLIREASE